MKSIYTRNLCNSFLKKKKIVFICWIVIVLVFCAVGVVKAYPEKVSSSASEEIQEYEKALKKYDDAIEGVQDNIELAQQQVDKQEKYCENSVLMQIDPSNVQTASVQYVIKVPDMGTDAANNQIQYILSAWTSYITGGSVTSGISEELQDISKEYLSELISSSTSENILTVKVIHYDMEQAENILQKIEEKIDDYKITIENSLGNFEMSVIDTSQASVSDMNVRNTQNTNLNNLRSYKSSLTDYQTKLVSQQTTKKNYIEQYKPASVDSSSPKKTLLEYGALGVIAGIVIPFVLYALWYTLSGKVKSKEELVAADLTVLTTFNAKKGYATSVERSALNLKLLAQQNHVDTICVSVMGESAELQQVENEFKTALEKQDLGILSVQAGQEDAGQLQKVTEAGNSVLLIEAGRTSYTQVEEQLQFCRRFNISVWGCIVIE